MGASYKSMFSSRQALDLHIPMEGMPAFRGLTDCIYHWQGRGARASERVSLHVCAHFRSSLKVFRSSLCGSYPVRLKTTLDHHQHQSVRTGERS